MLIVPDIKEYEKYQNKQDNAGNSQGLFGMSTNENPPPFCSIIKGECEAFSESSPPGDDSHIMISYQFPYFNLFVSLNPIEKDTDIIKYIQMDISIISRQVRRCLP